MIPLIPAAGNVILCLCKRLHVKYMGACDKAVTIFSLNDTEALSASHDLISIEIVFDSNDHISS